MVLGAYTRKRVGRSFGSVIARFELHGSLGLFGQTRWRSRRRSATRKKSSIRQITFYMIKEFEIANCYVVLGMGTVVVLPSPIL